MNVFGLTGEMPETASLAQQIIGAAFLVHRSLGPGLTEKTYRECLLRELRSQGLFLERDKPIRLRFRGVSVDTGLRAELLVNQTVLVEVLTVPSFSETQITGALNRLIRCGCPLGILLNFQAPDLRQGIKKLIR